MTQSISDFEPEFDETEIGRLTDDEFKAANLRHEVFLAREREEMETLERELDAELNQMFSLTKADRIDRDRPDPPGGPEL